MPLIRQVRKSEAAALDALLQFYQYDFSSMIDVHPDRTGRYRFVRIHGRDRRHFLIRRAGRVAGFASVRLGRIEHGVRGAQIDEFFVMLRHRRRGVGRRAARALFARFPGEWRVEELRVNRPAIRFWHGVIRGAAAGGRFREFISGGMLVQRFRSR